MKLYYKAGACSLAPHIVMSELNMVYELETVDLATKVCASGDFRKINPKGSVPTLKMDNGEILTEGSVISQYLADQKNDSTLLPKFGTMDRYRCQEWLNFVGTEIHKNFSPLFRTSVTQPEGLEQLREGTKETLRQKIGFVSEKLGDKKFLLGDQFTIADAYLFTCLNWSRVVGLDLTPWGNIVSYQSRVAERPAVIKAMKEEGLI